MHGNVGQGKEHAKWSPVATAWYKLLPEVVILKVCPRRLFCVLIVSTWHLNVRVFCRRVAEVSHSVCW